MLEILLILAGLVGGVDGAGFGVGVSSGYALALMAVFDAGADEGGEQRMRSQGLGLEFGMELAAYEPRVVGGFDDFDVDAVGGASGDAEASAGERVFVFAIEFVAVAMAL